jgi:hypothetical protein
MGLSPETYFRIGLVALYVAFLIWRRLRKEKKGVNPSSRMTRFRAMLAKKIQPHPAVGEAWCIGCSVNGGRTQAFMAESIENHVKTSHAGQPYVEIDVRWDMNRGAHVT